MGIEIYKDLIGKKYNIFGTPLCLELEKVFELKPDFFVAYFKDSNFVCNVQLLRNENGEAVI